MERIHRWRKGLAVAAIAILLVLGKQSTVAAPDTEGLEPRAFLPLVFRSLPPWKGVVQAQGQGLAGLEASWFYNYQPWNGWETPGWVPIVRPPHCEERSELDTLATLAAEYPGRTWLVFNEPDLQSQDAMPPEQSAELYETLFDTIKGADDSAMLFCCGTSFSNTAWLETFRQSMTRPVDGIHFHGYPCRSEDSQECEDNYWGFYDRFEMELAFTKLDSFYDYCQEHDEFANHPVWLTEFGILSNTDWDTREEVLEGVMLPFLAYLRNGGLDKFEKAAWFSDRYAPLDASDLAFQDGSLTVLGQAWAEAGVW